MPREDLLLSSASRQVPFLYVLATLTLITAMLY
jgi:hypothetical protein